ncbi:hypothetical protein J6590_108672 [Homalodisca vitripennis]|nr:hypothetical protein J6590_108255 [Homalodisca vitripennis]KAG8334133.1 hypothetical protein J6590_108672 [Homalodisca vitripennis]
MKKSIWATYFHKSSTLDKPMHGLCPEGVESWCKYNRSKALKVSPTPTNNLPIAVMEHIKPIYKDLADPNLLKKCVHGKTQNQNESFNNMIWTRISKNNFVGLSTLTIGVQDAILCYNDGALGKIKVLDKLCGQAGTNCVVGLKRQDELRIFEAEKAMKDIEKKQKKSEKQ